jgi:hypothetical protein
LNCEVIEEHKLLQEAERSAEADSENDLGGSSDDMYFIGLDVHKRPSDRTLVQTGTKEQG